MITSNSIGPLEPEVLPWSDPAVQFGAGGLFETIRVERGRPHLFNAHMDRLEASARVWKVQMPCERGEVLSAIRAETERVGDILQRVRITLGPDPNSGVFAEFAVGRVFVSAEPLPPRYRPPLPERQPYNVSVFRDYVFSTTEPWRGHKSTQYYAYWEALRRARTRGFEEALLLNERGELVEAAAFNLFFFMEDRLITPSAECGPLPGVFAAHVSGICDSLGVRVEEVRAFPEMLEQTQCVFLTNSLGEMIGIKSIDGKSTPDVRSHAAARELMHALEDGRADRA